MDALLAVAPYCELFFLLCIGHALTDFALISQWMSEEIENHPYSFALPAHSLISALPVYVVTGSVVLALAETITHFVIDWLGLSGRINGWQNQMLLIGTKLLWVGMLALELPFLME
ncbi:hypothetical protein D3C87_1239130 [compost metagenome]